MIGGDVSGAAEPTGHDQTNSLYDTHGQVVNCIASIHKDVQGRHRQTDRQTDNEQTER